MTALAKVLAICAGTVGGAAACVATGVVPAPLLDPPAAPRAARAGEGRPPPRGTSRRGAGRRRERPTTEYETAPPSEVEAEPEPQPTGSGARRKNHEEEAEGEARRRSGRRRRSAPPAEAAAERKRRDRIRRTAAGADRRPNRAPRRPPRPRRRRRSSSLVERHRRRGVRAVRRTAPSRRDAGAPPARGARPRSRRRLARRAPRASDGYDLTGLRPRRRRLARRPTQFQVEWDPNPAASAKPRPLRGPRAPTADRLPGSAATTRSGGTAATVGVPPVPGVYRFEAGRTGRRRHGPDRWPAVCAPLYFDDARPARRSSIAAPAWVAAGHRVPIHLGHPAAPLPLSGIQGYAVSIDGAAAGSPCARGRSLRGGRDRPPGRGRRTTRSPSPPRRKGSATSTRSPSRGPGWPRPDRHRADRRRRHAAAGAPRRRPRRLGDRAGDG